MKLRWFAQYAWVLFVLMPGFLVFEALLGLAGQLLPKQNYIESVTGSSWVQIEASNPEIARYIELVGTDSYWLQLGLALFMIVVAATGYRTNQRWAWWLFWWLPVGGLINAAILFGRHEINIFPFVIPFVLIALVGLLLPIRRFFSSVPTKTGS